MDVAYLNMCFGSDVSKKIIVEKHGKVAKILTRSHLGHDNTALWSDVLTDAPNAIIKQ